MSFLWAVDYLMMMMPVTANRNVTVVVFKGGEITMEAINNDDNCRRITNWYKNSAQSCTLSMTP
jgi:hypothetical protein